MNCGCVYVPYPDLDPEENVMTMIDRHKAAIMEKWSDEQVAQAAAKLMYAPGLKENVALVWVIERLILPPDIRGYTEDQIRQRLTEALKEAKGKWESSKTDANPTPKA